MEVSVHFVKDVKKELWTLTMDGGRVVHVLRIKVQSDEDKVIFNLFSADKEALTIKEADNVQV